MKLTNDNLTVVNETPSPSWIDTSSIPLNYQGIHLHNLEIHSTTFLSQFPGGAGWLPGFLRDYSQMNFLFDGPSGTGKSTCLVALYDHALRQEAEAHMRALNQPAIWKISTMELSREFRDWSISKARPRAADEYEPIIRYPTVTATDINNAIRKGITPRLFLEDFDKCNIESPFLQSSLFEVFDALVTGGGQLVVTSGLSYEELENRLGAQYGPGILRRICGEPNGIRINFATGRYCWPPHPKSIGYGQTPKGCTKPLPKKFKTTKSAFNFSCQS